MVHERSNPDARHVTWSLTAPVQVLIAMALWVVVCPPCLAQKTAATKNSNAKNGNGDWPCLRGPGGTGVSPARGLPQDWSDSKNVVWRTALPGAGASSPIAFGDHVYVTCYSAHAANREHEFREDVTRHLVCMDRATGRILWDAKHATQGMDQGNRVLIALF